jgi:hypothetical protein
LAGEDVFGQGEESPGHLANFGGKLELIKRAAVEGFAALCSGFSKVGSRTQGGKMCFRRHDTHLLASP